MQKVRIELNNGKKIDIELYPEYAPKSVENFIDLVKSGFYDGLCFHRVIDGFMIQGGGFSWGGGLMPKSAPRTIKGEFKMNGINNTLHHALGALHVLFFRRAERSDTRAPSEEHGLESRI